MTGLRPGAVALVSGGVDSAVLLAVLRQQDGGLVSLCVDYGQRHRREVFASASVAKAIGVDEHVEFDLRDFSRFVHGSSLTDSKVDVPHGHYADESMKMTVVPNRNMVLLSIAASLAISRGLDRVAYAAHGGDHPIYADCRPEFVTDLSAALKSATDTDIDLYTPFLGLSKTDVVRIGLDLHVPFHLTWSCYEGGDEPCLKCGTCVERMEAFSECGVPDPLVDLDERARMSNY